MDSEIDRLGPLRMVEHYSLREVRGGVEEDDDTLMYYMFVQPLFSNYINVVIHDNPFCIFQIRTTKSYLTIRYKTFETNTDPVSVMGLENLNIMTINNDQSVPLFRAGKYII